MAFVEERARETWSVILARTFEVALRTLETEPTGPLGSAADDLRGWLLVGGAPRGREAVGDVEVVWPTSRELRSYRRGHGPLLVLDGSSGHECEGIGRLAPRPVSDAPGPPFGTRST